MKNLKILIVDDSLPILELASTMLKLLGYEPIKAAGCLIKI